MTGRVTFGDFARAVTRHLDAAAQPSATYPNPATSATEVQEFTYGLQRLLKVMGHYLADIAASPDMRSGSQRSDIGPWSREVAEARAALQQVRHYLPIATNRISRRPEPQLTGSVTRELDAAATSLATGRDLLQAHFATEQDGTRKPRSEWAPLISSKPASQALLAELARWAGQIGTQAAHLTSRAAQSRSSTAQHHQRLIAVSHWLAVMASAVDVAHSQDPVPDRAWLLLSVVPANVLQPRRLPSRNETVTQLTRGIADSAERARHAATRVAAEASWLPTMTAESFRQSAASATVISYNCSILQNALAARTTHYGSATFARKLRASAETATRTQHAWLVAARAWYEIRTDAPAGITQAAVEAADLALWTGRLAYADPDWTPALGPDHVARPPHALAATPADLAEVAAAVHQATSTLAALAAADYDQIATAHQTGRLLVPTVTPAMSADGSAQITTTFTRAPTRPVRTLLTAYRNAGTASARAAAAITEIAADITTHQGLPPPASGMAWAASNEARGREVAIMLAPAAAAATADDQMPGPVERILRELGVERHDLLTRGRAIDKASSQLIDEASDDTAPLRWHTAARRLTASPDVAQIVNHVLARDRPHAALVTGLYAASIQIRCSQAQQDSMQAEP